MLGRLRKQITFGFYSFLVVLTLLSTALFAVPSTASAESTGVPPRGDRPCYTLKQISFSVSSDTSRFSEYLPVPGKFFFRVSQDGYILVRNSSSPNGFTAEKLDTKYFGVQMTLSTPDSINIGPGKDLVELSPKNESGCQSGEGNEVVNEINLTAFSKHLAQQNSSVCDVFGEYSSCLRDAGTGLGAANNQAATLLEKGKSVDRDFQINTAYINKLIGEQPAEDKPLAGQPNLLKVSIFPIVALKQNINPDDPVAPVGPSTGGIINIAFFKYVFPAYIEVFPDAKTLIDAGDKDIPGPVQGGGDASNPVNTGSGSNDPIKQPDTAISFIYTIVSSLVLLTTQVMYQVFAYFLAPVILALLKIHPYQDSFVNVIYPGWIILRNLSNIFFIIALLYFGLSLIFQLGEPKRTRKFITDLIIAALLVNFSLVIAQGILGIADTVQAQFLPADSKVIEALANQLMAKPVQAMNLSAGSTSQQLAELTRPIILLFVAAIAFFTFWVLAIVLFVRIVALWLLLATSPIAYVGGLMSYTSKFRSQWFDYFFRYALVTPIIAFFLNLAALMTLADTLKTGISLDGAGFLGGFANMGVIIASNCLIIAFMLLGLGIASSFKIKVADKAEGWARKQLSKPQKWASSMGKSTADYGKYLGSLGLAKVEKGIGGISLRPGEYTQAFKEQRKKNLEKAMKERFVPSDGKTTPAYLAKNFGKIIAAKWDARQNKEDIARLPGLQLASEALTDDKVNAKRAELGNKQSSLASVQRRYNAAERDEANKTDATAALKSLQSEEDRQFAEANALEKEALQQFDFGKINAAERDSKVADARERRSKAEDFKRDREKFEADVTAMADDDYIKVPVVLGFRAFNKDTLQSQLKKEIRDLQAEANKISKELQDDVDNKNKLKDLGYTKFAPDDIARYKKQASELQSKVLNARLPESYYARNLRLEREKEAAESFKEIEDIGELLIRYDAAVAQKNGALAGALMKKLAKEGSFGDLLDQVGVKSNPQAVQNYVRKVLGTVGFGETDKQQFASELSKINAANNHAAGMKLVTVSGGNLTWTTPDQHEDMVSKIIGGKAPEDVVKLGKAALVYEQDNGTKVLSSGAVKAYTQMSADAAERHLKNLAFNKAKAITDVPDWERQLVGADEDVIKGIKRAARIT